MIDGFGKVEVIPNNKTNEKEQNKKIKHTKMICATAVTGLAISLAATGYFHLNENTKFTYVSDEDNNFKAEGKVKYSKVKDWCLVEKELINGEHKLFICDGNYGIFNQSYKDIFNYSTICEGYVKTSGKLADDTLIKKKKIEDYLLAYDMVKAYYTIDDMDKLLDMIEEDYEYTDNKTLEKEYQ